MSDSAGAGARWAPDGKTIYYWRGPTLVSVSVATTPTFRVTGARDLFTRREGNPSLGYELSPNGKQIIMAVRPPETTNALSARAFEPMRLVVVTNWLDEVKRKLEAVR